MLLVPLTFNLKCQLCLKEENDLFLLLAFDLSNNSSLIAKTRNNIIILKHFFSSSAQRPSQSFYFVSDKDESVCV